MVSERESQQAEREPWRGSGGGGDRNLWSGKEGLVGRKRAVVVVRACDFDVRTH